MYPQIKPDYCLTILKAFSDALPPDTTKRKSVKALDVLDETADLLSCTANDLEPSYRYLLDKKLIQLKVPGKVAPIAKGPFPAYVPSASETLQAPTKRHRVLAVTSAGYTLIRLSEDQSCKPKLSLQAVFDNACKLATLGKTLLEIKEKLFP